MQTHTSSTNVTYQKEQYGEVSFVFKPRQGDERVFLNRTALSPLLTDMNGDAENAGFLLGRKAGASLRIDRYSPLKNGVVKERENGGMNVDYTKFEENLRDARKNGNGLFDSIIHVHSHPPPHQMFAGFKSGETFLFTKNPDTRLELGYLGREEYEVGMLDASTTVFYINPKSKIAGFKVVMDAIVKLFNVPNEENGDTSRFARLGIYEINDMDTDPNVMPFALYGGKPKHNGILRKKESR